MVTKRNIQFAISSAASCLLHHVRMLGLFRTPAVQKMIYIATRRMKANSAFSQEKSEVVCDSIAHLSRINVVTSWGHQILHLLVHKAKGNRPKSRTRTREE